MAQRRTLRRERSRDVGRDQSDAATSQETPGTTGSCKRPGMAMASPSEPLEGVWSYKQLDFLLLFSRPVRE